LRKTLAVTGYVMIIMWTFFLVVFLAMASPIRLGSSGWTLSIEGWIIILLIALILLGVGIFSKERRVSTVSLPTLVSKFARAIQMAESESHAPF